jgi:asparagine synthase (glutamine-hydrolysing)
MCGLAGVVTAPSGRLAAANLETLRRAVAHRGPDDLGYWFWDGRGDPEATREPRDVEGSSVAFAHNRLSILDPSTNGRQPMVTGDRRCALVFNGLIYNYVELRAELEARGHSFRSTGDTAVLVAALVEWGEDALPRLEGMFALAFVDTRARSVLLARDFAGMKPLYLARWTGGLAFASEIRPLLDLPGVSRRANARHLAAYLRRGLVDHGDETLFEDVEQVGAGETRTIDLDGPELHAARPFWRARVERDDAPPFTAAAARLREALLENVEHHLRADVPLGVTLSGGIDSSAIVSLARRGSAEHELHAFAYVADDPALSEERWLCLAAEESGVVLHTTTPTADEFWRDLDELILAQEQPFGGPSVYAQYRVFALAREWGMKVVLSGQGADELFAGYHSYFAAREQSLIGQGREAEARRFARAGAPRRTLRDRFRRLSRQQWQPWLRDDWLRERAGVESADSVDSGDPFRDRILDAFARRSLPHLLRYEDRNSMHFALESRLPFLTPALADFVFSLPDEYLIDERATTKALLRESLKGILPEPIRTRRDKVGFQTPDGAWLRRHAERIEELLRSDAARSNPSVNTEAAETELRAALGRDERDGAFWRHTWRTVNLVRWTELFDVELG